MTVKKQLSKLWDIKIIAKLQQCEWVVCAGAGFWGNVDMNSVSAHGCKVSNNVNDS
jgi:lactate dehydrogenase-like 2-hydroxyacid dehydrogenase